MTYVKTVLKKEIVIDSIITIHYFEYSKDFSFSGEAHNFWEFLYVDAGTVDVRSENKLYTLHAGDIIFHQPNCFHAMRSSPETFAEPGCNFLFYTISGNDGFF